LLKIRKEIFQRRKRR